jgi:hypothetical protein
VNKLYFLIFLLSASIAPFFALAQTPEVDSTSVNFRYPGDPVSILEQELLEANSRIINNDLEITLLTGLLVGGAIGSIIPAIGTLPGAFVGAVTSCVIYCVVKIGYLLHRQNRLQYVLQNSSR